MNTRAQSSVELLIVLSVAIVLLLVLVNYTTSSVSQLKEEYATRLARQSLNSLVEAINQTFSSGSGTIRTVTLQWPVGVDANNSRIVGNTVVVRVYQNDIVASAIPQIGGTFSVYPGTQRVQLVASDTNVSIHSVSFTVNPSSVYVPLSQDSNTLTTLEVTNFSGEDLDVNYSLSWPHEQVGLEVVSATDPVEAGETGTATLRVSAGASSLGNYVGTITVSTSTSAGAEYESVPINVEVFPGSVGVLSVYSNPIRIHGYSGDTSASLISVCNNAGTDLKQVSFSTSSGNPGSWIQGVSTIDTISAA
ncbi:MAG: hypothetical protein AABY11_03795, partial [archaeon]